MTSLAGLEADPDEGLVRLIPVEIVFRRMAVALLAQYKEDFVLFGAFQDLGVLFWVMSFVTVDSPGTEKIGAFDVTFVPMSHSIPDAVGIGVRTSDGFVFYTGDFKIDESPVVDARVTSFG